MKNRTQSDCFIPFGRLNIAIKRKNARGMRIEMVKIGWVSCKKDYEGKNYAFFQQENGIVGYPKSFVTRLGIFRRISDASKMRNEPPHNNNHHRNVNIRRTIYHFNYTTPIYIMCLFSILYLNPANVCEETHLQCLLRVKFSDGRLSERKTTAG